MLVKVDCPGEIGESPVSVAQFGTGNVNADLISRYAIAVEQTEYGIGRDVAVMDPLLQAISELDALGSGTTRSCTLIMHLHQYKEYHYSPRGKPFVQNMKIFYKKIHCFISICLLTKVLASPQM